MQLPTSISIQPPSSTSYTSRQSAQIEPSRSERANSDSESVQETGTSVDRSEETARSQVQVEQTNVVESPAQSELPSQDTVVRAESSGNSSVDQYQQIASQEENNAQSQDPSLFRVDVYV